MANRSACRTATSCTFNAHYATPARCARNCDPNNPPNPNPTARPTTLNQRYDSWWYWKECGNSPTNTWIKCKGAVELWEPRDDVFPDGFNFKPDNLPLVLHNRWFSAVNNTYIKDYGFGGSFIVEEAVDFALPIKADVFVGFVWFEALSPTLD